MLLAVACYAAVQVRFFTPAVRETDTAGYLMLAERIAQGGPLTFAADDPFLYHSHVWVESADGRVVPKYPPGLPLLMGVGLRLFGPHGPFLVSPVAGALALIGLYKLFMLWMSPAAAALAVVVMAGNHVVLTYAGYPLAHAAELCFVAWGMYLLWKWCASKNWLHGAGAGLCLGFTPTIRASGVLFILPAVAACLFMVVKDRFRVRQLWRPVLGLAAGFCVFPLLHMLYNAAVFGNPLVTGYALSDEQWAFSFARLLSNTAWALRGFGAECIPVMFGIGLAAMIVTKPWQERIMRFAWWVPVVLLYASYYWASPRFGLAFYRFYIGLIPVFVGSAFAMLDRVTPERGRLCALVVVAAGTVILHADQSLQGMRRIVNSSGLRNQQLAAEHAMDVLQDGAAIYAATEVAFHIGPGRNFVLYDLSAFSPGYARMNFANPAPMEPRRQPSRTERFRTFYENKGQDALNRMKIASMAAHLEAGRQVALVIPVSQFRHRQQVIGGVFDVRNVAEWTGTAERWRRDGAGGHAMAVEEQQWALYEVHPRQPSGTSQQTGDAEE